jgi:hypothetical protein
MIRRQEWEQGQVRAADIEDDPKAAPFLPLGGPTLRDLL